MNDFSMKKAIRSAAYIPLLLLCAFAVYAGDGGAEIAVNDVHNGIPLGKHLLIAEDRGKIWTAEEIAAGMHGKDFKPCNVDFPGFGYNQNSAYWARFRVRNDSDAEARWFLEFSYPLMDRIDVYVLSADGKVVDRRRAGDAFTFNKREFNYRHFVFAFSEKALSTSDYLVRCETRGAMNIYLQMWSQEGFRVNSTGKMFLLGMYYGVMFIMLFYNLFIYFSVRDKSYIYFVVYCLALIVFQSMMDGTGFQYVWSYSTWWVNHGIVMVIMSVVGLSIQFSRYYLHVNEHLPRFDRALVGLMVLCGLVTAVSFFVDYTIIVRIAMVITITSAVIISCLSINILAHGYRPARFYVAAWTTFWIGTVIYGLKFFTLLPEVAFTRYVMQFTSLIQLVLLSIGLADKINFMRRDLEALNINLENKVEYRTAELNAALKRMTQREKEIQIEFELAGNIQRGILPSMPFYYEGIKIDAYYQAMGEVGGDFYDIFMMKGGYVGVLIADASGHGMPAAFITALAKISFVEAIQNSLFPADIFKHVNAELIEAIKTDDFVTVFFTVISPTFDVFYGNASHQKALVLRTQTRDIDEWDTNGLFMGSMAAANSMYEEKQDHLDYGDRILLYTDGITEAKNPRNETFGEARLKASLIETAALSLADAKERIIETWNEFRGTAPQTDDVTLMLIEIDPAYRLLIDFREKGFKLLWQRKYGEAIEVLNQALAINPKDEKCHLYLGECHLKAGDYTSAVAHFQHFLKNNDVDANVWNHLAEAYYNLENYEMAYHTARKATHLRNNFVDAMVTCGLSLKGMGRYEEAARQWLRILTIDKDNAVALRESGTGGSGPE